MITMSCLLSFAAYLMPPYALLIIRVSFLFRLSARGGGRLIVIVVIFLRVIGIVVIYLSAAGPAITTWICGVNDFSNSSAGPQSVNLRFVNDETLAMPLAGALTYAPK